MMGGFFQLLIGLVLIGAGLLAIRDRVSIADDIEDRQVAYFGRLAKMLQRGDRAAGILVAALGAMLLGVLSIAASIVLFVRA